MPKNPDTILKLSLAAAALIAGAGVGYHYGIYLPAQDLRRQTQWMAAEQARAEAEHKALAERAAREAAAQTEYQDCTAFAETSYKARWTMSCLSLHDADLAAYEDCADNLFATEEGCRAKVPVRPERDCALPAQVADALTRARDERKSQCLARLEAMQRGRPASPLPPTGDATGLP
jgi:hypothetical protein